MRTEPFDSQPPSAAGGSNFEAHTMDLTSHLRQEARDNTATGNQQQPATETEQQEQPAASPSAAGKFEDGKPAGPEPTKQFDEFVKQLEDADAVTLSNILVQIFNVGRIFFVPNLYFNLTYSGQERYDIRTVMDKAVENEKKNTEPTTGFNDYEKRLYKKLPKLREATEGCSYTQPEMEELSKLLARRIQEMTVAVFLSRYMWILFILYLEMKHGQFVIEQKGTDFFQQKLGMK